MRVNKQNQLGLNFPKEVRDKFFEIQSQTVFSRFKELASGDVEMDDSLKSAVEQWRWILSDEKNTNLLFTKTALDVCDNIKIGKFKPSILKIKSAKKLTLLIDSKSFYRITMSGDEIFALYVTVNGNYWEYVAFKIHPNKDLVFYKSNYTTDSDVYMNDDVFVKFLKMIIFTEYSDIKEEILLKPNHKHGTRKQGKYLNESDKNFTIVDSTWNKVIVRSDGFGVSGHFRLQPFGANREDRKLIYISEYLKNGYVRGAKKNKNDKTS